MESFHINAVLQHVPQNDFLPAANDENRLLLSKVEQLLEQRDQKNEFNIQLEQRVNWLQNQYKCSQDELQQNLHLIDAHCKQFESEHHLYKLAENAHTAVKKDFADLENAFRQLGERDRLAEHDTNRLNGTIDAMSSDMHWMKNAIVEWMQAMEHGNRTNELIEKYCKSDQKRADALDLRRCKLQTNILNNVTLLNELCEEQASLEQMLDRTAQLYRQSHLDRRDMVETWRGTAAAMNSRDNSIRVTNEKIAATYQQMIEKQNELRIQTVFLQQQIGNNRDIELDSGECNDRIARKQIQFGRLNDAFDLDTSEWNTAKQILRSQSEKLQQLRRQNRQAMIDREAKNKAIAALKGTCEELSDKLKKMHNQSDSAQNRLKQLDELVEMEEKSLNDVETELVRLSQMLFRSKSVLDQWQSEHKLVEMEITVLETTIKTINANFRAQEKTLHRQMEMQHDAQFKVLAAEERIKKLSGATMDVDPDLLKKLECMEKIHKIVGEKRKCVAKQLELVESSERKLTHTLTENTIEHQRTSDELRDNQMQYDGGMNCLQQHRNELSERLVEHSLLKMRLHQMQSTFEKQMGKLFDLAMHESQLQLAIDERMIEVRSQLNVLAMQRKHLCDEKSQLVADINERRLKIDALRARFVLTNELLGKNEDGTHVSVVQLKIEMAQKKECLMERGSRLNEQVIAAENDIKALENTLIMLNYANDQWKRSTLPQSCEQDEVDMNKAVESLSDELAKRMQHLKNTKCNITTMTEQIQMLNAEYVECENQLMHLSHQRIENNHTLMQYHKHLLEQKTKLQRAEHESKAARKSMQQFIGDQEYIRIFEKDLNAKALEHKNKSALHQIADIIDGVHGLGPLIKKHLFDRGLRMPTPTASIFDSTLSFSKQSDRSDTSAHHSRLSSALIGPKHENMPAVSRLKSNSSSATTSRSSIPSSTTSKKSNSRRREQSEAPDFSIDGQAIGTGKSTK